MEDESSRQEMKNRIVEKLLRQGVVGARYIQKDTISAWVPSHQSKEIRQALDELSRSPASPIRIDPRGNVQLESVGDAVEYLRENEGRVPFGVEETEPAEEIDKDKIKEDDRLSRLADQLESTNNELQSTNEELKSMNEAAADWRKKARRRQRLSLAIGVVGFVIGLVTQLII